MVGAAGSAQTPKTDTGALSFNASTGKLTVTGIENTPIGAATASTGAFTTLSATGTVDFTAGTVGTPSLRFGGDTTTGIYRIGANNLGVSISGAKVLDIASTGLAVTGTLSATGFAYAGGRLRINREDSSSEGGQLELCNASGNTVAWYFDAYGSSSTPTLRIFDASAVGVSLVSGSTSWSTMSDINLKTDLQPIVNAVDALKDIRCVTYHLKDKDEPTSRKRIGIIAQDIMGKIDEAIDSSHNEADGKDYLSVRYAELVPHLIKAVQELSEKNKALEARLAALESK